MKAAPLQLADYWALSTHVDANPDYDAKEKPKLDLSLIDVTHAIKLIDDFGDDGTRWLIDLTIEQGLADNNNIPYSFRIHMQGTVLAHPSFKDERLRQVVSVNGPAMLFGAAREIIRAATGRGPYKAVLIPSTNFFSAVESKPSATKKTAAKKPVKKSAAKRARKPVKD